MKEAPQNRRAKQPFKLTGGNVANVPVNGDNFGSCKNKVVRATWWTIAVASPKPKHV